MAVLRIHTKCADGSCVQTPYAMNKETGQIVNAPITNTAKIPISAVRNTGTIAITETEFNSMLKNNSGMNNNTGIQSGETVQGRANISRRESADVNTGNLQTVWFTFDNTAASASDFMLGDAAGLCALGLGLTAPAGTLTVTSSYGASGLAYFAALTRSIPMRLHKLHIVNTATASSTASTGFFDNGSLKDCRASVNNSTVVQNIIDLRMLVTPDTYQTSIRQETEYRTLIDALQGWRFTIPALQKITFTLYVRSIGDVFAMNLNLI